MGNGDEFCSFMIVELEMNDWAGFPTARTMRLATIGIALYASEGILHEVSSRCAAMAIQHTVRAVGGNFGKALWRFAHKLELRGLRN